MINPFLKPFLIKLLKFLKLKQFQQIVSILVILILFLFIYKFIDNNLGELKYIWLNANLLLLLLTFPVFFVLSAGAGIMWSNIAQQFGICFPTNMNIRIYLLTLAARRLPGSFLHVLGRITIYKKFGTSAKTLAFISTLEIALIIWSGFIVSIISSLFFFNTFTQLYWILGLGLLISSILIHPKILNYLFKRILNPDSSFHELSYSVLLNWLLGYSLLWVLGGGMLNLIVLAFSPNSIEYFIQILTGWTISGMSGILITFLPSGLGVVEMTLTLILTPFTSSTMAVSIAIASRILQTLYDFLISAVFFLFEKIINPKGLLK